MKFVLERTDQFLKILKSSIEQKKIAVCNIQYSEGREYPTRWNDFDTDAYWGKNDAWYWFRTEIKIPKEYEGERVECHLVTGRENFWNALNPQFLLHINSNVKQGLDTNHQTFCLSDTATAGEIFTVELEAYAGRELGNMKFKDMPLQFELYTYCRNADAERLYFDLYTARNAAGIFSERDYNRICIEEYLTNALNMIDARIPSSAEYFCSVREAADYMKKEFYGKFCGHDVAVADCIGHTHIDVAWLWRLEQTRAKAVRSFATELMLLDEYPEHQFTSSQPQLYQFVKEDYPDVYEKIRNKIKEGRWEAEGAMWLEADCNLISGESLIRQILHGKRFLKEEFDVDSKVLWLPDVFGYSAAMPQLMKKSGIDTFVTSKIHWNETNHFPYDTFIWKGIDGTEIFTQFITASENNAKLGDFSDTYSTYNSKLTPISIAKGWEIYQQKNINNEILVSFGYGDGGGGVTHEMLELNKRLSCGIPGVPKTRITTVSEAIERIKNNTKGKKIPKWFGELYLELHRGTYTSMAKNKRYNRLSEFLLQHTETVSLANKILLGGKYDKEEIYKSWTTVLLNQFHDIIPGSSIREVYRDSERQYKILTDENRLRSDTALNGIAASCNRKGIFIYNPAGTAQSGIVKYGGISYFAKDIPACGWKVIDEVHEETDKARKLSVSKNRMENQYFVIELNKKGLITRIYDKKNNREVIQKGKYANILEALDDHPRSYDNWELCSYSAEKFWEIDDVTEMEVCDEDELSAGLRITRKFLNSEIVQKIIIYRDIPRIDFDTETDWHEHHIFVKAAFPVDIISDKATYEIQFGTVERPAHSNTSWDAAKFEVCAHKWADYAEPDYGVALINDCKYGYDIHDGVMKISLIKCGTYPNPDADIGYHKFRYSLMPHKGDWREAGVVKEAYAFNCPLIALKTDGKGILSDECALVMSDKTNIIITALKEACESEDIILRMYEAHGIRTQTQISCSFSVDRVYETDMMENEIEQLSVENNRFETNFGPYEVKTFVLKRVNLTTDITT